MADAARRAELLALIDDAEASSGEILLLPDELRDLLADSEAADRIRSDVAEIRETLIAERNAARAEVEQLGKECSRLGRLLGERSNSEHAGRLPER